MKSSKRLHIPAMLHIAQWSGCKACDLCEGRRQVIFYRGVIPCKVLFIASAPDSLSDGASKPFPDNVVPSQGSIISGCMSTAPSALTYLVSCGPVQKQEDLTDAQRLACWPKFLQFLSLANPQILMTMDNGALSWIAKNMADVINKLNRRPICLSMNHPFWIGNQKDPDLEIQKIKRKIEDAIDNWVLPY